MKLLLVSDLHSHWPWFDWIAEAKTDGVLIAGDLIDGFSPEGLLPQMVKVSQWASRLRSPLAVCSGNHDANFRGALGAVYMESKGSTAEALVRAPRWMDALARPGIVVDGRSEVANWAEHRVVVTTIPYSGFDDTLLADSLWRAGDQLRREHRVRWLVLHHEPPAGTAVGCAQGDASLWWRVREYQPDYVVSGHLHEQPYFSDGNFADRIGKTWCFNPGSPPTEASSRAVWPNHIILDSDAHTAEWHAHLVEEHREIKRAIFLE